LQHYDKYIRERTGLRINSIEKVYSKITATLKEGIEPSEPIRNRLAHEFEDYNDKLAPLRCLARYMNIRKQNILIKESLIQRIQGWNAIVAAIIPALITIILSLLGLRK
jgi:hypothetical protein